MRITSIRAVLVALFALFSASPLYAQIPSTYYPSYAPGVANPSSGGWLEGWAGGGITNNWQGGWAGFNYAFNHNVWSSGFLLRGEGGGGHYDYTNAAIINGVQIGHVNVTY